jgi:hypothetical protein
MRVLSIALLFSGPFLVLLSAAQKPPLKEPKPPKPRETPEVPLTPSPGAQKEIARTTKAMQGLWILKELVWPHLDGLDSEFRGYCLVNDNHLSFEVHIGLRDQNRKLGSVLLDSGLWRFEVGDANRTILTALIGSYIDKDNRVAFREAETQHRYEVIALGDEMIWRKEDGQRLVFKRLLDNGPPRVDLFGRALPEKKDDAAKDDEGKKEPPK